jgi:hypothetical protein
MKWISGIWVLLATGQVWAIDPVNVPLAVQMQRAANLSICETYKGDKSPFGQAMNRRCREQATAEFNDMQDQRSLKECIKPGNVIDDDVRKCMKGL